ncbi:MAG: thiol reductase thioredoxin [Gammaproteobacteria bacterium]|jgi:thioredoxin|nr:thiol reductase thioredoxin [Gammaproteobacteria bacterium]
MKTENKGNVIALTQANFDQTIENNEMVIIDFWAEWCGPCRSFAPAFEACAKKHPDIVFGTVDIEQEQQLTINFEVRTIPLIVIIRSQVVLYSESGSMTEGELDKLIARMRQLDMKPLQDQIKSQEKEEKEKRN